MALGVSIKEKNKASWSLVVMTSGLSVICEFSGGFLPPNYSVAKAYRNSLNPNEHVIPLA